MISEFFKIQATQSLTVAINDTNNYPRCRHISTGGNFEWADKERVTLLPHVKNNGATGYLAYKTLFMSKSRVSRQHSYVVDTRSIGMIRRHL